MDFKRDILPLKDIIFRTALRITMNREESEDIVQDILLKLWQQRDELETVSNLEAFALTSARNLAIDRISKHEQRNISLVEETHDREDVWQMSAHDTMERDERQANIASVIATLPEKQRTVLQLRDIEGKAYKEIAEIIGITESDVKVNLFRARGFLKEKLHFLRRDK